MAEIKEEVRALRNGKGQAFKFSREGLSLVYLGERPDAERIEADFAFALRRATSLKAGETLRAFAPSGSAAAILEDQGGPAAAVADYVKGAAALGPLAAWRAISAPFFRSLCAAAGVSPGAWESAFRDAVEADADVVALGKLGLSFEEAVAELEKMGRA